MAYRRSLSSQISCCGWPLHAATHPKVVGHRLRRRPRRIGIYLVLIVLTECLAQLLAKLLDRLLLQLLHAQLAGARSIREELQSRSKQDKTSLIQSAPHLQLLKRSIHGPDERVRALALAARAASDRRPTNGNASEVVSVLAVPLVLADVALHAEREGPISEDSRGTGVARSDKEE